jgi:hypothetical protein
LHFINGLIPVKLVTLHRLVTILTPHEAIFKDFILSAGPEGKDWVIRIIQFPIHYFFTGIAGYAGAFSAIVIWHRKKGIGGTGTDREFYQHNELSQVPVIIPDRSLWTSKSTGRYLHYCYYIRTVQKPVLLPVVPHAHSHP